METQKGIRDLTGFSVADADREASQVRRLTGAANQSEQISEEIRERAIQKLHSFLNDPLEGIEPLERKFTPEEIQALTADLRLE